MKGEQQTAKKAAKKRARAAGRNGKSPSSPKKRTSPEDPLQQYRKELSALSTLGTEMGAGLSVKQVVATALREIRKTVSPDVALFYLRQNSDMTLLGSFPVSKAFNRMGKGVERVGQCLCGTAARGKPVYARDIHTDRRCTLSECKKAGIRSFAALPLKGKDGVVGVLGLASRIERDFSQQAAFLETMTSLIAVALQNALMLEQAQQHAEKLQIAIQEAWNAKVKSDTVLRAIYDPITIQDTNFTVTYQNPAQEAVMGKRVGELCYEAFENTDHVCDGCALAASFKDGTVHKTERTITNEKGTFQYEITASPIRDAAGTIVAGIEVARDITERKHTEETLLHLNRVYALLSNVNQAIVRIRDRKKLFEEICRIAVQDGKFRMAWIGLVEGKSKKVVVAASGGATADYLDHLDITLTDTPEGHGPTATAIHTGDHAISNDIEHDDHMKPWSALALRSGYRSSASFPLIVSGRTIGTLNLYAAETGFFNEQEIKLLDELAADISFALEFSEGEEQRKRAEEALRESAERLRLALRAADQGLYDLNVQTGDAIVNDEYATMLGYDPATFQETNAKWIERLHPDDREPVASVYREYVAGTIPEYKVEFRQKTRSGDWKWILSLGKIVERDAAGNPLRMLGTHTDITERKKTEELMRRGLDRLRLLVDRMPTACIMWSPEFRVELWNPAAERIFGYAAHEVIGRHPYGLIVPAKAQPHVDVVWRRNLEGDTTAHSENENITKDGRTIICQWSNTPIRDSDGKVTGVLSMTQDITGRKQAERERTRLFSVLERSLNEIYMFDAETLRFRYVNTGALRNLGFSRAAMESMTPLDIKPEYTEASFHALIEPLLAHQQDKQVFYTVHRRADGSRYPVEVHLQLVEHEQERMFLAVIIDITERTRADEEKQKLHSQLLQAQKMEAVGQLAGGIAHDFNNILTAIIGYGNMALMQARSDDPVRSYIDQMLVGAQRAAGLTQSLLAFSRKQIINPQLISINAVIERVEKLLLRIIGEDVELKTTLTAEDTTALADPGQIEQVLINLATNARDAMPNGGDLMIETGRVEIGEDYTRAQGYGQPGPFVTVSVTDTGAGMDEKTRERIFEPFFTTKEVGKGTGLGLSIIYGIVKQHSGYINVYSEPGRGTTFRIYLPFANAAVEQPPGEQALPALQRGTETILLAEDDKPLRDLTKKVLEEFGYTVIAAADGQDAVEQFLLNKDRIQLLLVDVIMPKKNGRQVYEEVKRGAPAIKVLFMSGYPADIIQKKGVLEEGLLFISKPLSPQQLLRKIRSVLDAKP